MQGVCYVAAAACPGSCRVACILPARASLAVALRTAPGVAGPRRARAWGGWERVATSGLRLGQFEQPTCLSSLGLYFQPSQ